VAACRAEADRGVLICGTGIGMCITANKVPGVRAAPCHDAITAEMSRRHNDANVLCLSADLLGEDQIERLLGIWLNTEFEGGRHARRAATGVGRRWGSGGSRVTMTCPRPGGSMGSGRGGVPVPKVSDTIPHRLTPSTGCT